MARRFQQCFFADGDTVKVVDGTACRIKGEWIGNEKADVTVRISEDGKEYTKIYYSPEEPKLIMDTTHSGSKGIRLIGKAPKKLDNYKMFPTNPY